MNAWQRLHASLGNGPATEIPCWPQTFLYSVRFCPGGMTEYCTQARAFVEAQLTALETFQYDAVGAGPDITMEAESLGASIVIPPDAEPYISGHPLPPGSSLDGLRVPDPWTTGRLRMVLRATEMLAGRVRGTVPVFCQLRSPFVLASNLVGIEPIMTALYDCPDWVRALVEFTTGFCARYGRALIDAGADVLEIGNAVAGMLPADLYRGFAADPLKRVVRHFHDAGAVVAVHMCGQTGHLIGDMIQSGADILEIDSPLRIPDLARQYGRSVAWLGNIHPVDVLLKGPPARIRAITLDLLEAMGRGPGFILSTGCEPSILTPVDHLQALVEAVRQFNAAGEVAEGSPNPEVQAR